MKNILKRSTSVITAFLFILITSGNNIHAMVNKTEADAVSYRTNYTIYGDLDKDNRIDIYDVIEMRKKVVSEDDSKKLDFNYDGKVDSADLTLLSDYVLGKNTFFDAYFYDDADGDNICDLLEVSLLKTNPDSEDTDGDTLSDYDEIVYTKTSPINKYTNSSSVTDAEDDIDKDNLTNKEEITFGTNPLLSDSDSDGISDYDELKKYMTDPNNDDTDDDCIIDGDEIALGLNPSTNKSDGSTPDNQRTFDQNIASSNKILSSVNAEDSPYELSIDIISAGIAEKELKATIGEFSNASDNEKIIGKSVSLVYTDKLSVDSAKIYFSPKDAEVKINNYMIFEYFPDTNYLLPVETKYTDNAAYVETSDLGTFCLVNMENMFGENNSSYALSSREIDILSSETKVPSDSIVWDYELDETEVAFFVDISGCLDEKNLEETQKSIHDFSQALFEHCDNAAVEIIGYYANTASGDSVCGYYADLEKNKIFNSIESVDEAISTIKPYTSNQNNDLNTPIYILQNLIKDGLYSSECKNKYTFIISDSTYTFTDRLGYKVTIPTVTCNSLDSIYNASVNLNFLLSSENYSKTTAVNNLKNACKPYEFGVYSKSQTGYFGNKSYAKIYSDAVVDLAYLSYYYMCSVSPAEMPERVERNAFINSLPSSFDISKVPAADSDGYINFKDAAVKIGAAYIDKNGNLVFKSLSDACDISELTYRGYEQLIKQINTSTGLILGELQIIPFSEKILYADNDGDGIPNKDDPYPDEAFDERFMIVDDFDYIPEVDFVETHYQHGKKCYNTSNEPIISNYAAILIDVLTNYVEAAGAVTPLLQLFELEKTENENFMETYEHFCCFLSHYADPFFKGKCKKLSQSDMENIIFTQKNNIEHYVYNLNTMKNCAEQVVNDNTNKNNCVNISTTSENNFLVCCYDALNCSHDGGYDNSKALDWGYAIGESLGGMTAQVYYSDGKYHMDLKYYLIDTYEFPYHWTLEDHDDTLSIAMHGLHETGRAEEYRIIGCYQDSFDWKKGETLYESLYNPKIKVNTDSYYSEFID